jgi:hypothetical protein
LKNGSSSLRGPRTKQLAGHLKHGKLIDVKFLQHLSFSRRFTSVILVSAVAAVAAGCGRDDVKVYQVAKEAPPASPPPAEAPALAPAPAMDTAAVPAQTANALPQFQFALPPGWQQIAASQMRVASFTVTNPSGPAGDVGIIPLPASGNDENELALVNMWRDQLQLPPTDHADPVEITVGSNPAKLFEFVSSAPVLDGKYLQRNLVAMQTRGAMSWFFKLTGEDAFVTSQKDNFLQFLKSFTFSDNAPAAAQTAAPGADMAAVTAAATPSVPTDLINSMWTVPAGWQSVTPSQFLLAQFIIQANGAQAEVNVSQLAGEGGGLLANVNRWRRQLGLPPVSQEEDFSKMVDSLTVPGGQVQVVDFNGTNVKTGQAARLVGVVLPRNGQTWFYKLMGDPGVVAAQKDAFLKFIQSARYPDAH